MHPFVGSFRGLFGTDRDLLLDVVVGLDAIAIADAANQAGLSRRYGGIHFEQGDLDARATGRIAARTVWEKSREYWNGG